MGAGHAPPALIKAVAATGDGEDPRLEPLYDAAIIDTLRRFEATGSPVVTDGEQRKYHNFWTYCVHGSANVAPDGFKNPFAAGHARRMPRLVSAPFRYRRRANSDLKFAREHTQRPVKQAVISPAALSLMYPDEGITGYSKEQIIHDLLHEHETAVRACLEGGAHKVQIDFTEARLAVKLDPTGELLNSFINLNNLALSRFSASERQKIGIHTCPGGDRDSTPSADVAYAELLPSLLPLNAGNFDIALAGEKDPGHVLKIIREHRPPSHRIFVGATATSNPRSETPEEVRARVLQAAEYIPVGQLGTTDDCGYAPICDDTSTSRDTAFEKIRARVLGTSWPPKSSDRGDGRGRERSTAVALRRAEKGQQHPAGAPAGGGGTRRRQRGLGSSDGRTRPIAGFDARHPGGFHGWDSGDQRRRARHPLQRELSADLADPSPR